MRKSATPRIAVSTRREILDGDFEIGSGSRNGDDVAERFSVGHKATSKSKGKSAPKRTFFC
jgi:hypothetical protein